MKGCMTVTTSHSLSMGEANQSVDLLIFNPAPPVRCVLTRLASFVFSNKAGSFLPQGLYTCKSFCLELSLAHSPFSGFSPLQSKGLSRVFSSTAVQKHQFFSAQPFFYCPALTSIHDYWKNQSFDYTDLCRQSNISAF